MGVRASRLSVAVAAAVLVRAMKSIWLEFVVGCFGTFRMSLLISKEEGPAETARKAGSNGVLLRVVPIVLVGMITALFFAVTDRIRWIDFVLYWLAFSAGAIVLNQAFTED